MVRVLDIDLDFFVTPPVHWPPDWERPPAEEFTVWDAGSAREFVSGRCGVDLPLPGFITQTHDELFYRWRDAIDSGALTPPFEVTHVDAHADLGLGDAGWAYLMSDLLFAPVEQRRDPRTGGQGLNEGNFLLFAMACRWISDLVYVFGEGGGDDEISYILPDRKRPASELQLLGVGSHGIDLLLNGQEPDVLHREPSVPYRSMRWEKFAAVGRYDFICLTRSPRYTPNTADPLFDMLCDEFVDASVDV